MIKLNIIDEGLSTVDYKVKEITKFDLFTHILVDIDKWKILKYDNFDKLFYSEESLKS